ncbi:DeoR/GlpR transcriptional regulator [Burkholderia glumae]|uniref:DeoR/GlpR family DNA-binding transcription regulator n=1 Tax=Burkholderia glumae TaxID=337 RepID=UPI000F5DF954|nr:DeoR/GlpR family DNA-binding transcription regulator [Burkholderia glumae]MCQ0033062.1 DeoR/GlpR family DNA-binding transcription regulator [Burkholderia glumae]MCQ0038080.1 DeoR/GlpR family DNA-binding transcription regulator [Burkholderia glumae]QJW82268.1 DeoR/GlpR transcriptional regulator [Burkholderia glumae]RQZ67643.1 DeoR/GlpR transcriptional regulator [Burkholderia glumae]UVS84093.1 DeoR/GlpR transcriptional regulator [Burkholderia glumae]
MKVARRREAMLQAVLSGMTEVSELCEHFGMSEATVRRDLRALADERLILRTYGGAASVSTHAPEESLEQRRRSFQAEKDAIGHAAAAHVQAGDTIFLDSGTTTAALARALAGAGRHDVRVVTNNLLVVQALAASNVPLTLIGGEVRESSMSTLGPIAQLALTRVTVDKAFLGADGVVPGRGLCEATADQAYLKECLMRQAARLYVLVTADKLNRDSQQHWAPIDKPWTLITDASASHAELQAFRELTGVTIEPVAVMASAAGGPGALQSH